MKKLHFFLLLTFILSACGILFYNHNLNKYFMEVSFPQIPMTGFIYSSNANSASNSNGESELSSADSSRVLLFNNRNNVSSMIKIAIGNAITSNKLEEKMAFNYTTLEVMKAVFPFFKTFLPSFCKTASVGYHYNIFLAYDSVDLFFSNATNEDIFFKGIARTLDQVCVPRNLTVSVHRVICSHTKKPAWAQNDAMMEAYLHNMDYYYRLNDDSLLITPNWTEKFIGVLAAYNPPNIGVVGPTHSGGNTGILTYDFVHKTHIDMFGFYYPRAFTDWYGDNWMTNVYKPGKSTKVKSIRLRHTLENGRRYPLQGGGGLLKSETLKGRAIVIRYIEASAKNISIVPTPSLQIAMSLYGKDDDMLWGAIRNAQLASLLYPEWTLTFYTCHKPCPNQSHEVPDAIIKKILALGAKVHLINDDIAINTSPNFWSYAVLQNEEVEMFIQRDVRNRLTFRGSSAVNEFKASNWLVHSIHHTSDTKDTPVVANLWAMKLTNNTYLQTFQDAVFKSNTSNTLLRDIYQKLSGRIMHHSYRACTTSAILKQENTYVINATTLVEEGFMGQRFTWNMQPVKPLKKALTNC